ncbi:nuclease HARBI1 [Trichonephila clavipes]|nr:nuclease HARBI1 [Trichonephila clavipes]
MALKLNLKKDELISVAVEMGLKIPSKAKIIDLKKIIESSAVYKNDIEFVRSLVENALEKSKQEAEENEREAEKNKREAEKYKREAEIQLEKIKLSQIEKQLEKVRKESEKNSQSLESGEPSSITDKLEKKAFQIKSVPDELKAKILLNILGERVNNLLTYVSQEDLSNYVKIKELILREFEPTPQECLSNFKKARKLPSENYVQFASRLSATFDYYCQLRKVNEFRSLWDLIISDKIFETLDRDTMNHIATKQGETYFKPQQLGRECDVYLSARGKVSNDLMSRNPGSGVKTDGRYRLQTVGTWRRERNSSNVFVAETKTNCVLLSRKFFSIAGFPKVIGALDGTFVRIVSPGGEDAERFRCRKNYFALNVQTIVDSDLVIRNVVARWPGSAHYSTVFNNSAACLSLKTNALYKYFHLLGDTGYAREKYLLTPFGNPRSLSEARRFPCLSIGLNCHIDRVPAIVVACCVLHNLCIRLEDPEPPADPQIEALVHQLELKNEDATLSFETRPYCPASFAKRNIIVTNFFSN